jgi:hypothetical protein
MLSLPAEFIQDAKPPAEHFLEKLRGMKMPATRPLTYAEVAAKLPTALMEASHVTSEVEEPLHLWLHSTLALIRCWPGRPNFFKLEIGGRRKTVSVDRLKPHLGMAPVMSALPPLFVDSHLPPD